jgi:bifunctional enzyme CysN/CysC
MISGAAEADAAILVVDGAEGVQEQTRRHAYLLHILGIKQIGVVINKLDRVEYSTDTFQSVKKDITAYLKSINVTPHFVIPISARHGDMIKDRGEVLSWYKDKTVVGMLDSFETYTDRQELPLRFPVQDIYREQNDRIVVGRVETGALKVGDKICFSPTDEVATIKTIRVWPEDKSKVKAMPGECIGITLDRKIFVERGHVGSSLANRPILSNVFQANIFWLGAKPLFVGAQFKLRYATFETMATVQSIDHALNTQDLSLDDAAKEVDKGNIAEVTLRTARVLPLDQHTDHPYSGRIVLYEGYDIVGGGLVNLEHYPDQRQDEPKSDNIQAVSHLTTYEERVQRNQHYGGVFWFTGLSGAGKSTLAMAVEHELFRLGYQTRVLDGDNIRHGLCSDLAFSPEDRAENIRRVGEVAALLAKTGIITITAFISPYRQDRLRASRASNELFHEIYISADLAACEERDPKGLYKKARSGEISDFTGIDSPYEPPDNPNLIIDTVNYTPQECVRKIVSYVEKHISIAPQTKKLKKGERFVIS